ncbi:hypothetical protein ILUMI_17547, partial [Ignelater luminosus]
YSSEMCTNNYSWANGNLDLQWSRFPASNYSHLVNKTVVELFIVVHYLVKQSQRSVQFKNCPNSNISAEEFRS